MEHSTAFNLVKNQFKKTQTSNHPSTDKIIEIPVKEEATFQESIKATHEAEKTLVPGGQSYSAAFEKDYRNFCKVIAKGEDYIRLCNWDKYVCIHYRTEIPDKLLTGPWTEDDIRLLFWLVRCGACVQWGAESTTAEVSFF